MNCPTEAELIEMENRARCLLDQTATDVRELERRDSSGYKRPFPWEWIALEKRDALARDALALVGVVRSASGGRAGAP